MYTFLYIRLYIYMYIVYTCIVGLYACVRISVVCKYIYIPFGSYERNPQYRNKKENFKKKKGNERTENRGGIAQHAVVVKVTGAATGTERPR